MSTTDPILTHLGQFTDPETAGEIADALYLSRSTGLSALYRLKELSRVRMSGVAFDGSRAWALAQ
jgi:hypothetical protein